MAQINLGDPGEPPSEISRTTALKRALRRGVIGLIATLTLLGPAASAASAPPSFRLVFRSPRVPLSDATRPHGYLVDNHAVYVASLHDGLHITCRSLNASRWRWDTLVGPASDAQVSLRLSGGVLLVTTGSRVIALDPGSGRRVWSRAGTLAASDARGHVVIRSGDNEESSGPVSLSATNAATGKALWTLRTADADWALAQNSDGGLVWPAQIAFWGRGALETEDPGTQSIVATRAIELTPYAMQWLGHVIVVAGLEKAVGLDSRTLDVRWIYQRYIFMGENGLNRCQRRWCAYNGAEVVTVDPATGKAEVRRLGTEGSDDGIPLTAEPIAGWTLMTSAESELRVVDPITLHVVFRLTAWRIRLPADHQVGDAFVVMRNDGWIGLVPTRSPRLIPLGRVAEDEAAQCVARDGYLGCWSENGVLRVWRYDRW